jgi:transcriptional regulator with XRE-family HTH domain
LAGCPEAGFGQRLKSFRLAAGLVQRGLAREAGTTQQNITSYERDRNRPRPAALARRAEALGVPPAALEPPGPVPHRLPRPK